MPALQNNTHSGLGVIYHLEHVFKSWDVCMDALVYMAVLWSLMTMLSGSCQVHGLGTAVLVKEALSVHAMGRRIGEWVVSSSGPKGFSRFPHEAWKRLPNELSWMRRLYVEQYLAGELHLDPSVEVDVQGMLTDPLCYTRLLKHALL